MKGETAEDRETMNETGLAIAAVLRGDQISVELACLIAALILETCENINYLAELARINWGD